MDDRPWKLFGGPDDWSITYDDLSNVSFTNEQRKEQRCREEKTFATYKQSVYTAQKISHLPLFPA
jgi:hypothetical protein